MFGLQFCFTKSKDTLEKVVDESSQHFCTDFAAYQQFTQNVGLRTAKRTRAIYNSNLVFTGLKSKAKQTNIKRKYKN